MIGARNFFQLKMLKQKNFTKSLRKELLEKAVLPNSDEAAAFAAEKCLNFEVVVFGFQISNE